MKGGIISGNKVGGNDARGGGVSLNWGAFTMSGGTIYGSSEGANANTAQRNAALANRNATAKWGSGGAYTKGGVPQSGGSDIGVADETLIATPQGVSGP